MCAKARYVMIWRACSENEARLVRARSASNIAALLELGAEAASVEELGESAGVISMVRGWIADSILRFAGVDKTSAGSREIRMRASACEA